MTCIDFYLLESMKTQLQPSGWQTLGAWWWSYSELTTAHDGALQGKSHNRTPTSPPEYVQKYIQQTLCKWDHLSGSLANAPSLFNIRALPASRTVPDQREVRGRGGRRGLRPSHGFSRAKKGRLAGSTFLGDPFSRQGCEQNLPRWSICSIRNALKISYFFLRDFIGINEEILHI